MLIPIGLGFLAFLLYMSTRRASASEANLSRAIKNAETPGQLEAVARMADRDGLADTAKALHAKADIRREIEKVEQRFNAKVKSPIPGVDDTRWSSYVRWAKTGGLETITPAYNLGLFVLNMRTLEDFGYAKGVKKVDYKGKQVWKGDFIEPYTLEGFLSDPRLQYEAFIKMSLNHREAILNRYKEYIGQVDYQGKKMTLSGLMGVAKVAGLGGLDKWLGEPSTRKPATDKAFIGANGMF